MKPLTRNLIVAAIVLVAVFSFLGVRFYAGAGQFTTLTAAMEVSPQCVVVASPPGPEDIVIDHERGIAFVAATDRRAITAGAENVRGGIYAIDLSGDPTTWTLRPVTAHVPAAFQPHGLGLYVDSAGVRTLAVVNHTGDVDSVELFDVAEDGILSHRATVRDQGMFALNDVQPVGHSTFYATNDHGSASALQNLVSDVLMLSPASLVYFDGTTVREVASDLAYANGVNVSPDGKTVYVAQTSGLTLNIYDRDIATGDLSQTDFVALGTGLDNVDVAPDGTLLIGAHPKLLDFVSHAADEKNLSPSQVVRLIPRAGGGGVADTVYLNLGDQLSGSSVAATYGDLMLVSGVFDPKILVCDIAPPRGN
jgi:arylesterase/paraoxonase